MNNIKRSFPRSQLISAFVVFLTVLGLGFIFQEALKDTLLVYIQYVLWVGELAFKSFDQRCIWLLALVITLVLTLKFSRYKTEKPIEKPKTPLPPRSSETRRINFWRKRIEVMRSAVERDYYLSDLYQLIIKTLVYHEESNPVDIRERLRSGDLAVPSEVHEILGLVDLQSSPEQQIGIIQRIQQGFHWIRNIFKTQTDLPDPRLEKVAAYLESLLENDHDV
jgi:hypothetical protein